MEMAWDFPAWEITWLSVPHAWSTGQGCNELPVLLESPSNPCSQGIKQSCNSAVYVGEKCHGEALFGRKRFFFPHSLFFLVKDKKSHVCSVDSSGWTLQSLQKIPVVCFPPSQLPRVDMLHALGCQIQFGSSMGQRPIIPHYPNKGHTHLADTYIYICINKYIYKIILPIKPRVVMVIWKLL